MDVLEQILAEAKALPLLDWVITLTGILYLLLATRNNIWCWFWGIISCSLWAYSSFVNYQLYLDAGLQVFYVVMGFLGWYRWKYGGAQGQLSISKNQWSYNGVIIVTGVVLSLIFGFFFEKYTPAASTYLDSFTTIFSVLATILLVQRRLDNWVYWVLIDAVYVYLYATRGAYLFSALMVWYVYLAAKAYFSWRAKWQTKNA